MLTSGVGSEREGNAGGVDIGVDIFVDEGRATDGVEVLAGATNRLSGWVSEMAGLADGPFSGFTAHLLRS